MKFIVIGRIINYLIEKKNIKELLSLEFSNKSN
jgi:hypothetical protein